MLRVQEEKTWDGGKSSLLSLTKISTFLGKVGKKKEFAMLTVPSIPK